MSENDRQRYVAYRSESDEVKIRFFGWTARWIIHYDRRAPDHYGVRASSRRSTLPLSIRANLTMRLGLDSMDLKPLLICKLRLLPSMAV